MASLGIGLGVTDRPSGPPGSLVYDPFTAADGTTLSGRVADTGQAWSVYNGAGQIAGGRLYAPPSAGTGRLQAGIASGVADCRVGVTLSAVPAAGYHTGLQFRRVDASNTFRLLNIVGTGLKLYRVSGGVSAEIGSSAVALASGVRLEVVLSGSQIEVFADGNSLFTVMDTAHQTATIHGVDVLDGDPATGRLDEIRVTR